MIKKDRPVEMKKMYVINKRFFVVLILVAFALTSVHVVSGQFKGCIETTHSA